MMPEAAWKRLQSVCAAWHLHLGEEQLAQFHRYYDLLLEWNERIDLTNVTDPMEIIDTHFLDSLSLLRYGTVPGTGEDVLDVGSGAGLPGVPLAILCPGTHFLLVDALRKRVDFLAEVAAAAVPNVRALHARVEDMARQPEYREHYPLVVSRAVAPLPVLTELLLPFARVGGIVYAYKGPGVAKEWTQGERAAKILGGQLRDPILTPLPDKAWQHQLIPIEKKRSTPPKYPRRPGIPQRRPLDA